MEGPSAASSAPVLQELSFYIDELLRLCQTDGELRMLGLKFQVEHAAAQVAFESHDDVPRSPSLGSQASNASIANDPRRSPSPHVSSPLQPQPPGAAVATALPDELATSHSLERRHMFAALRRVCDLAVGVMRHVHATHAGGTREPRFMYSSRDSGCGGGSEPPGAAEAANEVRGSSPDSPTASLAMASLRSNSVDDIDRFDVTAAWLQQGATLFHAAVQAATLALIADPLLRPPLQQRLLSQGLVALLRDTLTIDKHTELTCFAEGYKTALMNLLANFCFGNESVAGAITEMPQLINVILESTRIDEDNPGLVEWAEFAIRNVCVSSATAREHIAALRAVAVDPQSQAELRGPSNASLQLDSATGKVRFQTVEM